MGCDINNYLCKGLWFQIEAGLSSLDGDEKEEHSNDIYGNGGDSAEHVSPLMD